VLYCAQKCTDLTEFLDGPLTLLTGPSIILFLRFAAMDYDRNYMQISHQFSVQINSDVERTERIHKLRSATLTIQRNQTIQRQRDER